MTMPTLEDSEALALRLLSKSADAPNHHASPEVKQLLREAAMRISLLAGFADGIANPRGRAKRDGGGF